MENQEILYQWEITPQEEKIRIKKVIFPILIAISLIVYLIFFEQRQYYNINESFFWYTYHQLTTSSGNKFIGLFLIAIVFLVLLSIIWVFINLFIKFKAKYSEKYIITSLGFKVIFHNNIEKSYIWSDFKGYYQSEVNDEERQSKYYDELEFSLIKKGINFFDFFRVVKIRGEKESSEQIASILSKYLHQLDLKELRRNMYVFNICFFAVSVIIALSAIFFFSIKNESPQKNLQNSEVYYLEKFGSKTINLVKPNSILNGQTMIANTKVIVFLDSNDYRQEITSNKSYGFWSYKLSSTLEKNKEYQLTIEYFDQNNKLSDLKRYIIKILSNIN